MRQLFRSRRWRLAAAALGTSALGVPALALLSLSATASSGCLCDCSGTFNVATIHADVTVVSATTDGPGCGVFCSSQGDQVCLALGVKLLAPGACHVTAVAADGRQASADVTVEQTKTDCCGPHYTIDRAIDVTFSVPDASASGG
jgi:hypothetical protein